MRLHLVRFLPLALVGWACATGPAEPPRPETTGRAQSAIINGAQDTKHPAVVALILGKNSFAGACTGTIVKKDVESHVGMIVRRSRCDPLGDSFATGSVTK